MIRGRFSFLLALAIITLTFLTGIVFPIARAQAAVAFPSPDQLGQSSTNPFPFTTNAALQYLKSGVPNYGTTVGGIPYQDTATGKISAVGGIYYVLEAVGALAVGTPETNGQQASSGLYYPGAIGAGFKMTSLALTNPPVSSKEYVADLFNNLQSPLGVKPAYAQGIGFSSLSPVLELWKLFRDLAYVFFVLIFLAVGFLIMFRAKIGSQTAVTVQQMLPKLVISLILVTFSYAIAGLVLDVMYLLIYLLIGLFQFLGAGRSDFFTFSNLQNTAFSNNIFQNGLGLVGSVSSSAAGAVNEIVLKFLAIDQSGGPGQILGRSAGAILGILAFLIVAFAIIIAIFRTFFALLQAYVGIFFSVILAPIQLLMGSLPGQNTFSTWLKGLIDNVVVFPVIIFMLFVIAYFSKASNQGSSTFGFAAPQIGSSFAAGSNAFSAIIALGVIMAMPEAIKIAKGITSGKAGISLGDITKNLTQGVPLGARVGGAAIGGGGGALLGGAYKFATGGFRLSQFGEGAKEGLKKGTGLGIRGGAELAKASGGRQPAILNPITNALDRTEAEKKRRAIEMASYLMQAKKEEDEKKGDGSGTK